MPFNDPKWPVINPEPTIDQCIKSVRTSDLVKIVGITCASWAVGYLVGKPVRRFSANTAATLGSTFAPILVLQDLRGRFMGYAENDREVKIFGIHEIQPPVYPVQDPRTPTATGHVSENLRPKLNWKNYN
ncbi:NADH-ubiquinone oxidoreductase complex I [Fragilaria crotonensis]|nr:NADH-ubiquinone oxidoreductase complex I [Fragilaria crotonensis]